jgi:hypothetical protein
MLFWKFAGLASEVAQLKAQFVIKDADTSLRLER